MNGLAMYVAAKPATHNEMVERHAPLVKRIACHLINRLPASVQLEDLVQAGMIGLLEAARKNAVTNFVQASTSSINLLAIRHM